MEAASFLNSLYFTPSANRETEACSARQMETAKIGLSDKHPDFAGLSIILGG